MSLKNGKCSYCEGKLGESPIVGAPVMSGGRESIPVFCDEYCQSLHGKRQFRQKNSATGLRFNANNCGSDRDDNGDNRNPSNDVEAMRDKLD